MTDTTQRRPPYEGLRFMRAEMIEGVEWELWKGLVNTVWHVPSIDAIVKRNRYVGIGSTYTAAVYGLTIGQRYRSRDGAMRAAVKAAAGK